MAAMTGADTSIPVVGQILSWLHDEQGIDLPPEVVMGYLSQDPLTLN